MNSGTCSQMTQLSRENGPQQIIQSFSVLHDASYVKVLSFKFVTPWYLPYCHVISMSSRLFLIKTWFKHIRHCCGRLLYTSLRLSGHVLLSKFIMGESQTPFTYFPTLPTPSSHYHTQGTYPEIVLHWCAC